MTRVRRGSTGTMWSRPAENCAVVSRTSSDRPCTVTSMPSDVVETWVTSQSSSRTRTTEPGATSREGRDGAGSVAVSGGVVGAVVTEVILGRRRRWSRPIQASD